MKKVLITGAAGFVGGFLAEYLLSFGEYDVFGTYHSETSLQTSPIKDRIQFHKVDLLNAAEVSNSIKEIKPDTIIHLAAASSPAESFKDPIMTMHTNVDAEINVLEAVRNDNLVNTKIIIVSSGAIYGNVTTEDLPVDEETPLRPTNPYSVSKIAQDFFGIQYFLSYKLPIIRVRPFNHIGPRQKTGFVVSDFAKQIVDIEKGIQKPVIRVGNLEAKRDFTDVRDVVRAYVLLVEKGIAGEVYNIGSGVSRSIQSILDMLLSLSTTKISIEVDPAKMQPGDVANIVCDNKKISAITGWKPEIPIEQTLKDTLEYWRKQENA